VAAARWDAYYHDGQVNPDRRWSLPLLGALEELTEVDRPLRMANLGRLRELRRDHAGTVEIFLPMTPGPSGSTSPALGAGLGN